MYLYFEALKKFLEEYKKNPAGIVWIYQGTKIIGDLTSKEFSFKYRDWDGKVEIRANGICLYVPVAQFNPLINCAGFVECSINFDVLEYAREYMSSDGFEGE